MTKKRILVARTADRVFYVIDGEPKVSACYFTDDLSGNYTERDDDPYIAALRSLLKGVKRRGN